MSRKHRSKSEVVFLGYRLRTEKLWQLAGGTLALLVLVVVLPLYLHWSEVNYAAAFEELYPGDQVLQQTGDEADKSFQQEAAGGKDAELRKVLQMHREATGLSGVVGLALSGTYEEDGRNYRTDWISRAPELIRKTMRADGLTMRFGFDGEVASIRVEPVRGEVEVEESANEVYRNALLLEGDFFRLMPQEASEDWEISLEESRELGEQKCWVVRSSGPSGHSSRHWIDQETGLELMRATEVDFEGRRHVVSLEYAGHRDFEGYFLPTGYILIINGQVRGRASFETARINPGLQPWMFSMRE